MRVKLLVSRATVGGRQLPGDVIDVPRDEALRLIACRSAIPVRGRKKQEAVINVAEKT